MRVRPRVLRVIPSRRERPTRAFATAVVVSTSVAVGRVRPPRSRRAACFPLFFRSRRVPPRPDSVSTPIPEQRVPVRRETVIRGFHTPSRRDASECTATPVVRNVSAGLGFFPADPTERDASLRHTAQCFPTTGGPRPRRFLFFSLDRFDVLKR